MADNVNMYANVATVNADKRLCPGAKLIYIGLIGLSKEKGYCFAGNKTLAKSYAVTKGTISKWVNNLLSCGYISVDMVYKDNSKEVDERRIYIVVPNDTRIIRNDTRIIRNDTRIIRNDTRIIRNDTRIMNSDDTYNQNCIQTIMNSDDRPIIRNDEDNINVEYKVNVNCNNSTVDDGPSDHPISNNVESSDQNGQHSVVYDESSNNNDNKTARAPRKKKGDGQVAIRTQIYTNYDKELADEIIKWYDAVGVGKKISFEQIDAKVCDLLEACDNDTKLAINQIHYSYVNNYAAWYPPKNVVNRGELDMTARRNAAEPLSSFAEYNKGRRNK